MVQNLPYTMINKEEQKQYITGVVIEALPNTLFRVELEEPGSKGEKDVILTYLSGKMRIHRIRVLVGDRVKIQQDSYGGRGRIVQRLK